MIGEEAGWQGMRGVAQAVAKGEGGESENDY